MPGVIRAELCGSLRRRRETIGDIDILASAKDAAPIMDAFVKLPEVVQVVGQGPTKSSIVAGLHAPRREDHPQRRPARARRRASSPSGSVLHREQGAQHPPAAARHRSRAGRSTSMRLAEREEDAAGQDRGGHLQAARSSDTSPPELREDTGEIEAAEAKKLPRSSRSPTSAASSTTTPTYKRRHRHARGDGAGRQESGLRVLRHRRPLAVADHRPRPAAQYGQEAMGRDRQGQREALTGSRSSRGRRSTFWRTARSTTTTSCSRASTTSSRASTRSSACPRRR